MSESVVSQEEQNEEPKPLITVEQLVAMIESKVDAINDPLLIETIDQHKEQVISACKMMGLPFDQVEQRVDSIFQKVGEAIRAGMSTPEMKESMRNSLIVAFRRTYSPEQIDTLGNFYRDNPWAYESQAKFHLNIARVSEKPTKLLQDIVMAQLPTLLQEFGDLEL